MEYSDKIHQLIESYLRNSLNEKESNELNRLLQEDSVLSDQVKRFKETVDTLDNDSWTLGDFNPQNKISKSYFDFYLKEENKDYLKKLEALDVSEEKSKFRLRPFLAVASIAACILIGFFLFNNTSTNQSDYNLMADAYINSNDIPPYETRGSSISSDSIMLLIENSYREGNFEILNEAFDANKNNIGDQNMDVAMLYNGLAYIKQEKYKQAYEAFSNDEIFNNSLYDEHAEWYLALSLLKSNDIEAAKSIFIKISKDNKHFKSDEAKKILRKIR